MLCCCTMTLCTRGSCRRGRCSRSGVAAVDPGTAFAPAGHARRLGTRVPDAQHLAIRVLRHRPKAPQRGGVLVGRVALAKGRGAPLAAAPDLVAVSLHDHQMIHIALAHQLPQHPEAVALQALAGVRDDEVLPPRDRLAEERVLGIADLRAQGGVRRAPGAAPIKAVANHLLVASVLQAQYVSVEQHSVKITNPAPTVALGTACVRGCRGNAQILREERRNGGLAHGRGPEDPDGCRLPPRCHRGRRRLGARAAKAALELRGREGRAEPLAERFRQTEA
mmetsp:Transcript_18168/g.50539  ORF Transcript_18168/g.50539 Transcript_18168/m.50539 type:complete len:279 (-) Transcript_18168:122-958(-)